METVSVLRDQAVRTSKLVGSVQSDQLGLPTPCGEWDVRSLINHLCVVAQFCARVAGGEQVEPDYEADLVGDDPGGSYARRQKEMLDACTAPGLSDRMVHMMGTQLPGAVVQTLALLETVVHRWDLARAVGADPEIDPDVATLVLEQARLLDSDDLRAATPDQTTRSVPIGPAIEMPDDASPVDRLVAFLGRTP